MSSDGTPESLSRQSIFLLAGRGVGFVFSFAIPLVLVRLLQPEMFGQYKQYMLIAATFIQVADLGLPASLFYFLPGSHRSRPLFVSGVTAVLALVAAAATVLAWLGGPMIAGWLDAPELASVMPILGLYASLLLLSKYGESLPVIEKQPRTAGAVAFAAEFLKASCLIVGALVGQSLVAIAWASVVYGGLRLLWQVGYSLWLYGRRLFALSIRAIKRALRYAFPFAVASLLSTSLTYLHQYYVAARTDPATFAVYAIGCFNIPLTFVLYSTVVDVALVRMSEYFKESRHDATASLFRDLQIRLGVVFIPAFVFVAVFAKPIISVLFTDQYLAAAPVLVAYWSSVVWFTFADHAVLRSYDDTRFILAANAVGLLASAIAVVAFYEAAGLWGAALGYVAGLAVQRCAGIWRIAGLLGRGALDIVPFRKLFKTGLAATAAVVPVSLLVSDLSSLAAIVIAMPCFAVLYGAAIWFSGVPTRHDKERLLRFLRLAYRRL